jgi:hypothetical protein
MSADHAARIAARRRVIIAWWFAAFLLVAAIVGGRQAYRWAKTQRANQFVKAGDELAAEGKTNDAARKYHAALQLDPMGYRALQGAARLATKIGRPEAADLWAEVVKLPNTTVKDRQEYASVLVTLGRFKLAQPIIEPLLRNNPDTQTLLIASRYSRGSGDTAKAIEFAQIAVKRAPSDEEARFALANLLAASNDAAQRSEARKILWDLTATKGIHRQPAVEALAAAPELSADEQARVLQLLESDASPGIRDALLAADLRLQLHPDQAEKIFDQTAARWNNSENADLNDLARWLNLHQQPERVLSLYTIDRALTDNQLLLSRLDALATLQRWDDIESMLGHPNLTLDSSVVECFRARTAQEKNATLDAEAHWNHAISLAANDAYKLRFVANFAEQSHANAVALKAYEQLAKIPPQAVTAYRAIQRLSAMSGDASVQRAAAEKIATLAPNDPNATDQLAYLNLLAGSDLDKNFGTATSLAEKFPDRLAFRVTAALGYLRKHDPGLALAQFKGPPNAPPIEWEKTPPAWRVVYAATLMANEQSDAAREMIKTIPLDKLSPPERELIEPAK